MYGENKRIFNRIIYHFKQSSAMKTFMKPWVRPQATKKEVIVEGTEKVPIDSF